MNYTILYLFYPINNYYYLSYLYHLAREAIPQISDVSINSCKTYITVCQ